MNRAHRVQAMMRALPLLLGLALVFIVASPSSAQTDEPVTTEETTTDAEHDEAADPEEEARNQSLRDGEEVYAAVCQSCHQPGGVGLSGQFPALKGNENATDAAYVEDVVINGKSGEITVNGETFDGVMPPFSTLSDEDVANVVAYITNDLVAPAATVAVIEPTGPAAGTSLPGFSNLTYYIAFALSLFVGLLVLGPRIASQNDRLDTSWVDAGLKAVTIVLGFVIGIVFIPNWAMQSSTVAKLDRPIQDLIGSGLWAAGLGLGLWTLWYTHRESRI